MNENLVVSTENGNIPKLNAIQRIFGVIFSPGKLMSDLAQKPRVLFGLLLTAISPIVMLFSIFPMYKEYLRPTMENTYASMNIQLTPEQFEQYLDMSSMSGPFMAAVTTVVMLLVEALILWGIVKILKGEGKFKHYLSILGYTAVISMLSVIVVIITTIVTGTYSDVSYTSLASLIPNLKGSFIYGAAKSLDVFGIWQYIVIAIGISNVGKLSKTKAYLIVAFFLVAFMIFTGFSEVRAAALLN